METKGKKRKTAVGSKWKGINTPPPPNPDIVLIFHGLMAVSQKNINKIDFICHGLEDKHELKIIIGKWESGAFRQIERIEQPSKIIKFTTTNVQSEIKVFSKNLERKSFDWIVDIEREHRRKSCRYPI